MFVKPASAWCVTGVHFSVLPVRPSISQPTEFHLLIDHFQIMFLQEIHHCDVTAFDTFTVAGTTLFVKLIL